MTRDEATRLAHDVGKYVGRIARNSAVPLPSGRLMSRITAS